MKEKIDLLVKLAEEYVDYIREIESDEAEIEDGWRYLRGTPHSTDGIQVYRSIEPSEEVWAVILCKIEIAFYSKKIKFPYDYDSIDLVEIYHDAKCFLSNLKQEISLKKLNEEKIKRIQKIVELEKELKYLKEQT